MYLFILSILLYNTTFYTFNAGFFAERLAAMAVKSLMCKIFILHILRIHTNLDTFFFFFLHISSYSIPHTQCNSLVTDDPQGDTNTARNSAIFVGNGFTRSWPGNCDRDRQTPLRSRPWKALVKNKKRDWFFTYTNSDNQFKI